MTPIASGRPIPTARGRSPRAARLIERDQYRLQTLVLPRMRAVGSGDPTCDTAWVNAEPTAAFGHVEYFLPKDIYILENLEALGSLPRLVYFAALPLKIANGTGLPLRPVAFVPKR
jgi:kynurenine formamidase